MSVPEPIDPGDDWRRRVEVWLIQVAMVSPEPDETVQAWLDEAADGDELALQWTIRTWRSLSNLTTFDLERRLAALRAGR